MLESFKYVNHVGEVLEFGKDGLFANYNDLRDYEWQYDSNKNTISNFRKGVVQKTIPVVICADSEEEGLQKKNTFFEIMEKDAIAEQAGKIIIGDYYKECYVYASNKSEYLTDKRVLTTSLGIVGKGTWIKETRKDFIYTEEQAMTGKGYPYDYPYDYAIEGGNTGKLLNEHFAPCHFKISISGYALNPSIKIAGHTYKVNTTVEDKEILVIDSRNKSIILRKNNGDLVNQFSKRDKESYIFEKIPSGMSDVYWNSEYNFEITLFEERGEPKWI